MHTKLCYVRKCQKLVKNSEKQWFLVVFSDVLMKTHENDVGTCDNNCYLITSTIMVLPECVKSDETCKNMVFSEKHTLSKNVKTVLQTAGPTPKTRFRTSFKTLVTNVPYISKTQILAFFRFS